MSTRLIIFVVIILVLLGFLPAYIYIHHFSNKVLSDDNLAWAQFGTYLTGTLSPVIALTAALLTFSAGMITNRHNEVVLEKQQREKRPFVNVGYEDMENKVALTLHNKGLGPMQITRYAFVDAQGNEKSSIFDFLHGFDCTFNNYTGDLTDLVSSAPQSINLIRLKGRATDTKFTTNRDKLREVLGGLKVMIEYKDIYDQPMPPYSRSLKWFLRHPDLVKKQYPQGDEESDAAPEKRGK